MQDIEAILNEGNKSRTVAATNMNAESSRSHAVFCVKVSQNLLDAKTNVSHQLLSDGGGGAGAGESGQRSFIL